MHDDDDKNFSKLYSNHKKKTKQKQQKNQIMKTFLYHLLVPSMK